MKMVIIFQIETLRVNILTHYKITHTKINIKVSLLYFVIHSKRKTIFSLHFVFVLKELHYNVVYFFFVSALVALRSLLSLFFSPWFLWCVLQQPTNSNQNLMTNLGYDDNHCFNVRDKKTSHHAEKQNYLMIKRKSHLVGYTYCLNKGCFETDCLCFEMLFI